MRFIFTSQGASGSASLTNSLNLINSIYAAHGHFPPDKQYKLNYQTEEFSHLLGHSMKGIYSKDLNTIFEFFEDCFPNKKFHGMVHTFTLSSLENHLSKKLNNLVDKISIANFVRNPIKVYFSSKALVNKSIKFSRYGKKENLNTYENLLKDNPLILPTLNKIELRDYNNPLSTIEIVNSAKTVALMFNEASEFENIIKTYKIEQILLNQENFHTFLRETINFNGLISEIPVEIDCKTNSHRGHNRVEILSDEELFLIDYFLNDNAKVFINNHYPDNNLGFKNIKSEDTSNTQKLNLNQNPFNENLRNMRENLTLISTSKPKSQDLDFVKEKITSTLTVIDEFLLNNQQSNEETFEVWCKKIEFISENNENNENIIKINDELYKFPQNLGAVDPSMFTSKEEFLFLNPEIKELNKKKQKFNTLFKNPLRKFLKN